MNSPDKTSIERAKYGNRSSDRVSTNALVESWDDMLILLEAYRKKEISADSVTGSVPMSTMFKWLVDGTMTQEEFDKLVDGGEIHEIVLGKDSEGDPLSEEPSLLAMVEEVRARLAAFPEKSMTDSLTPEHVSEWSGNPEENLGGIGVVLTFDKKESDNEGPAASFTVEMRIHPPGRDHFDTAKAEIVFSGHSSFGDGMFFNAVVPLPLMKRGRRKLFMTIVEAGTRAPLRIPPDVAMAFREMHLTEIEIRHVRPKAK